MNQIEIIGKITKLVDDEIRCHQEKDYVMEIIRNDKYLYKEYLFQKRMKVLFMNDPEQVSVNEKLKMTILQNLLQ